MTSWLYDLLLLRSTEEEEKFFIQDSVGIEPSAVEAVVLNRCMPTDFIECTVYRGQLSTDSVAKTETERQVGCVSYSCHVERTTRVC